jgi:hypothetical protein
MNAAYDKDVLNTRLILGAKADDTPTPAMIILTGMNRAAMIDYRGFKQ